MTPPTTIGLTTLLCCVFTTSAHATVSYSFDGTLATHFTEDTTQSGVVFDQSGSGTLFYHNNNSSVAGEIPSSKVNNSFSALYDQSWEASIDAFIATSYNGPNQYIGLGFTLEGGSGRIYHGLEQDGGRTVYSESNIPTGLEADTVTTNEMVTLRLTFDASTKVLTTSADGLGVNFAVDTDDAVNNWGMSGSDAFTIGLSATHLDANIAADNSVYFDNFNAQVVPEPSSSSMMLIATTGLLLRRRRRE